MQEISNSLRQRLGARPQPQTHPDPDTLTAYVEQVLPAAERGRVIEHLAECRDCREVVSLSLPQLESQQPVTVAARPRWWVPAYRWATLAATIAIAATLIVEKPWQTGAPTPANRQEKTAGPANRSDQEKTPAVSDTARSDTGRIGQLTTPAPATSAPTKSTPIQPNNALHAPLLARNSSGAGEARVAPRITNLEASPQPLPRSAVAGGVLGGVRETDRPMAARRAPTAPAATLAQPQPTEAAHNAADQEYAAKDVVREAEVGETANVSTAAANVLPSAPEPQPLANTGAAAGVRKITPPPLNPTSTQTADYIAVTPPNVSPSQPPPSAGDTLKTTRNFGDKKSKSKMEVAKSKVVEAAKTVMDAANPARPPAGAQGFAGATMAAPSQKAQTRSELRRVLPAQAQWTILEGRLLVKSDAVGQWHEAYTQSPDVQFRFVEPRGSEVWAGGNHGTLIHSWNAGVDWSKMNVPASTASDITAIAIDGDNVQVKTSNGQTFVSTDHGQTWVPLEQQPK